MGSILEDLMSGVNLTHVTLKSSKADFLKGKGSVVFAESLNVPEVTIPQKAEESSQSKTEEKV